MNEPTYTLTMTAAERRRIHASLGQRAAALLDLGALTKYSRYRSLADRIGALKPDAPVEALHRAYDTWGDCVVDSGGTLWNIGDGMHASPSLASAVGVLTTGTANRHVSLVCKLDKPYTITTTVTP